MVPLVGIIEIIAVGKAFGKHVSSALISQPQHDICIAPLTIS